MTRKEALTELLGAVETGQCNHGSFLQDWHKDIAYSGGCGVNAHKAYDGSIDAAKALHEAVLGDLPASITDMTQEHLGKHGWRVKINWPHMCFQGSFTGSGPYAHDGYANNPARAWLIAVVKALISECRDE